ncbi:MAG TPA: DUF4412 domain-containing protein [Gemmatimonadales bacterium]|nr:DUF4412 domain-containing protein [Gemmatimonadales bacterium]
MMKLRVQFVPGALLLALLPTTVVAQGGTLPDGPAVVRRFVEAVGGEAAVMRQTGRHVTGRLEVPAQGVEGDLEVYAKAPNKLAVTVVIPGMVTVRNGFDGTVGWTLNPMEGPMLLDGLSLQQMQQSADFYSMLYPKRLFAAVETIGEEEFEGTPCYRVKVTTANGEEYFDFFNRTTGLLVGSVRTRSTAMGDMEATSLVSDWQPVGGVLLPHKTVQRVMGMEQIMTFTSIESGDVPDSVFALPEEVRALTQPE